MLVRLVRVAAVGLPMARAEGRVSRGGPEAAPRQARSGLLQAVGPRRLL